MENNKEKRLFMKRQQFYAVFLLVVILSVFISGCAGVSRINGFFANDEFKQHTTIIDFGLMFVIFFAMTYLGLTKVWGKGYGQAGTGKGAIVALSLALALAFAFAIISQTSFSITTIFPLAKAFFFLVCVFILTGLIIHSKMFGEGKLANFIAFVISLIALYLIFSIGTHMVCQMSDNMDDPACRSDFFNAFFNLLGRFFGIDSWTLGGGSGGSGGGSGQGQGGSGPGGTGPGTTPGTTPTGPIQGGCRLDIQFNFNDATPGSGAGALTQYLQAVKQMGASVKAVGFASTEGDERYNLGLARRRANNVRTMMNSIDSSVSVSPSNRRPTTIFDPSGALGTGTTNGNRRVVLTTGSVSSYVPAPGIGSLYGCNVTPVGPNATNVTPVPPTTPNATNATGPTPPNQGGSKWWLWLLLLLIPLGFILFRVGYNQWNKRMNGVNINNLNAQLLELIQLAIEKMVAITETVTPGNLTPQELNLFQNAVRTRGLLLRTRIRRNLGPTGLGGVIFAPALTGPQRAELIENVFACTYALRKANAILNERVKYFFWPKLLTVKRIERQLIESLVSPVVHHDGRITFTYRDHRPMGITAAGVEARMANAPQGAPAAGFTNLTLTRRTPGSNIWTHTTTTPITPGVYRYIFRVDRGGPPPVPREWDAANAERTGPALATHWNLVNVTNIATLASTRIP